MLAVAAQRVLAYSLLDFFFIRGPFCDWSAVVRVQEAEAGATRCFLRGQRPPRPSPRLQFTGAGEDGWQQAELRRSESRQGSR